MKTTKIVILNCIIVVLIFLVLECGARLLYPEFIGDFYGSNVTRGIRLHTETVKGVTFRVPYAGYPLERNLSEPLILVIGDSISYGYGLDFEDIYWVQLQRLLRLYLRHSSPNVVGLSGCGGNMLEQLTDLTSFISSRQQRNICAVIYQFNFNDISPETRAQMKSAGPPGGRTFALIRTNWLNRSVFLRVLQHYAGIWTKKTSGSCRDRGIYALGNFYTWTFGSQPFHSESERLWDEYRRKFATLTQVCDELGATLYVLVSPLLSDIDLNGVDPYWNKNHLDFSCATIKPLVRLAELCREHDVLLVDPTQYIRNGYENRIRGGNFVPYFFPGDDNHFNRVMAAYVAEYLAKSIIFDSPPNCVNLQPQTSARNSLALPERGRHSRALGR